MAQGSRITVWMVRVERLGMGLACVEICGLEFADEFFWEVS